MFIKVIIHINKKGRTLSPKEPINFLQVNIETLSNWFKNDGRPWQIYQFYKSLSVNLGLRLGPDLRAEWTF